MSFDDFPDLNLELGLLHQGRRNLVANLGSVVLVGGGRPEPDLRHVGEDRPEAENRSDGFRRRLEVFVFGRFGADGDEQLDDVDVATQLVAGIRIGRDNFEQNQLLR